MKPSLSISLLQTATHWHDPEANQEMFAQMFEGLPPSTDLVVLPEMFSTGFTMSSRQVAQTMSGDTVAWMVDQAARLDKWLCGSVVIEEAGEFYNRFIAADPRGVQVTYDKRHRFRMAGEHNYYSAGGAAVQFEVAGWKVCPMVCYDLRFPVWFRNRDSYDVLVCVANWPAPRQAAWNTLLRARAIENQAYCAGVNITGTDGNEVPYTGGSAVYTPDGEVLAESFDASAVINIELSAQRLLELREAFPVWQDADHFELVDE